LNGGYWGDTTVGVHNVIDDFHEAGDHTDTIGEIWTQPEFLAGTVNIINFHQAGTLTPGTGVFKMPFPVDGTLVSVILAAATSPTGDDIICDVNLNGTTVFTAGTDRPTIPAADADGVGGVAPMPDSVTVPTGVAVSAGDYLTVDIDQVGSTIAGENLTVSVAWRPDA
jgi:hypothetical protein